MRSLGGALVAVGAALGLAGVAALSAAGCSGDNSTGSPGGDSGGTDSTADSTADTSQGDSQESDTQGDSSTADTWVESSTPDSGTRDADASDGSALGAAMQAFANAEVQSICTRLLSGCPALDAGSYDLAGCERANAGYGWEGNLPDDYGAFVRGHMAFDSTKATACLSAIAALPIGTQTAAQWSTVTQACELVLTGTLAVGQTPCASSFECAPGAYCTVGDAGAGKCTALATQGQPCNTAITSGLEPIPDFMCSYLGSANTGLYCNIIATQTTGQGTCQPLLGGTGPCTAGQSCDCGGDTPGAYYDDQACSAASGGALCGDFGCGTSASYPYQGWCTGWVITDAGAGPG